MILDHAKGLLDRATTDLLIGPDWAANMAAVDAVGAVHSAVVYVKISRFISCSFVLFLTLSISIYLSISVLTASAS